MKIEDKQTVINVLRDAAKLYTMAGMQCDREGNHEKMREWADKAADCIGAIAIMEESK